MYNVTSGPANTGKAPGAPHPDVRPPGGLPHLTPCPELASIPNLVITNPISVFILLPHIHMF